MVRQSAVIVSVTLILLGIWQFPIVFGALTLLVSLFLSGSLERDRNLHEVAFYAVGPLPASFCKWLHRYGYAESAVRSLILGFIALIHASGTDKTRTLLVGIAFCASVVIGFLLLRWLQRRVRLNIRRWGYVRLSALIGTGFSFLLSGIRPELSWKSSWDVVLEIFKQPDFNRTAELINLLTSILNTSIAYLLERLFVSLGDIGDVLAFLLSTVLTTDLVLGFVIIAYSMFLLEVTERFARTADLRNSNGASNG